MKIRQHTINSKGDLRKALHNEHRKLERNLYEKLVRNMPSKLKMVIKIEGMHTQY